MKKIGLICLTLVLGLGGLGVAYATWTQELVVTETVETGEVDWEFYGNPAVVPTIPPPTITQDDYGLDPPGYTKNVASTTATFTDPDFDGDFDQLNLVIDNAYPGYANNIGFWVHNNGSIPVIYQNVIISDADETYTLTAPGLVDLDLNGNGFKDIRIAWGDNFGLQLHPSDWLNEGFGFSILQDDGIQGATGLTFTIELIVVQWNQYQ